MRSGSIWMVNTSACPWSRAGLTAFMFLAMFGSPGRPDFALPLSSTHAQAVCDRKKK
jgi:hypothetical protein